MPASLPTARLAQACLLPHTLVQRMLPMRSLVHIAFKGFMRRRTTYLNAPIATIQHTCLQASVKGQDPFLSEARFIPQARRTLCRGLWPIPG